jgi:Tfp pilus assembly protein PilP
MSNWHRLPFVLLAAVLIAGQLVVAPVPVVAQEAEQEAEDGDLESLGGDEIDVSKIDHILRGEQESQRGAVSSYDPAGRRDPFKSLLEGREESDEEASGVRPPGLAGMLIEEVKLGGIIQTESGILAFVQGRDNLSYIIRPGTKLYNGEVKEILPKKVVFRQQVNDPKQMKTYEEIVREVAD